MKWICNYAEFDTNRNGIEGEPFTLNADTYENAVNKANQELSKYYDVVEFEVSEVFEEDEENNDEGNKT